MRQLFSKFLSDESGATAIEYCLIAVGLSIVIITAVNGIGTTLNSKFTGVGPRFGLDTSYHLGNCFGVVGHVAGALLVGNTKNDNSQQNFALAITPTPGTVFTSQVNTSSDSVTRVVPALDAKLGLDYTYIFENQSMLSLEAGYQWTQYIDAVDRLSNTAVAGVGVGAVTRTTSSIGFDGPYLTLNWKV